MDMVLAKGFDMFGDSIVNARVLYRSRHGSSGSKLQIRTEWRYFSATFVIVTRSNGIRFQNPRKNAKSVAVRKKARFLNPNDFGRSTSASFKTTQHCAAGSVKVFKGYSSLSWQTRQCVIIDAGGAWSCMLLSSFHFANLEVYSWSQFRVSSAETSEFGATIKGVTDVSATTMQHMHILDWAPDAIRCNEMDVKALIEVETQGGEERVQVPNKRWWIERPYRDEGVERLQSVHTTNEELKDSNDILETNLDTHYFVVDDPLLSTAWSGLEWIHPYWCCEAASISNTWMIKF